MTKQEVVTAVAMAMKHQAHGLAAETADIIHQAPGRVYLPIKAVAALLNYQAMRLDGKLDLAELSQTVAWIKPKVVIVG